MPLSPTKSMLNIKSPGVMTSGGGGPESFGAGLRGGQAPFGALQRNGGALEKGLFKQKEHIIAIRR